MTYDPVALSNAKFWTRYTINHTTIIVANLPRGIVISSLIYCLIHCTYVQHTYTNMCARISRHFERMSFENYNGS